MRYTGAPVVCANVLQWAPSRVTRRGALTATAAAAAAAFPPSPRYLPPPSVSPHTHARPLLPLDGPRSSWSRGPLGTPTSPLWGPMVAWQAAFSSTKYTFAVPFTPEQRNGRFFLLLPIFRLRSFFLPLLHADFVTLTISFCSFVCLLACDRNAHTSINIQYSMYRSFWSLSLFSTILIFR